jgi:hypothetical protein
MSWQLTFHWGKERYMLWDILSLRIIIFNFLRLDFILGWNKGISLILYLKRLKYSLLWFRLVQSNLCVVDPNVNTFFIFHILRIENFQIWQCEHFEGSTDFLFQTQFLQIVWISSNKIHSNINILCTLTLKILK